MTLEPAFRRMEEILNTKRLTEAAEKDYVAQMKEKREAEFRRRLVRINDFDTQRWYTKIENARPFVEFFTSVPPWENPVGAIA